MLTVLTGRGRTLWPCVLEEIGAAMAEGCRNILLLTPEQYTLQAELELVERLRLPGLLGLEVLSPSRLSQRVFALAGSPQRVRVDARGKAMMLTDVLRLSRRELGYYGGAAQRRGFADKLSACIADFKRAGLTPQAVREAAQTLDEGEALRGKLTDMALLYARYEERLAGAFVDGEDVQEALLARLEDSGLLQGARVWVYGFDLVSPQLLRQLVAMTRLADSVRLALTWEDAAARDAVAFAPARATLARLGRRFDAEGLLWAQRRVGGAAHPGREIAWLERELFSVPARPFSGEVQAVTLWAASNPYDEAMRAAAAMLAFARKGVRFDQMAVALGDAEGYAGALETAFTRCGIPFHLNRRRPALAHPLLRALMAALRCVTRSWRAEDALGWLKSGLCGLTVEEAERMENCALERGLRGAKWRRPLSDPVLEDVRRRFVGPLEALQSALHDARDATDSLSAVYALLEAVDAYGTLCDWEARLRAQGMPAEAAACAQAWRLLLETLDQMHALMRGARVPMAGLAQMLEAGLASAELGALPPSPGVTQVGQMGHMKLGEGLRVLFVLGMQDGAMRQADDALLTDAEASRAEDALGEGALGLYGDALSALMQMHLLDTLCAPSDRLFVSYALTGADGGPQRPAAWLNALRRVFPEMPERGGADRDMWFAPGAALDALGPTLRRQARRGVLTLDTARAAAWLAHAPQTRAQAQAVLRALEAPSGELWLEPSMARALYAHTRTSVSRLEDFARCPYRHFIDYGLRPVERREFTVERRDLGTFYHRAIEGFAREAAACPDWPHITRAQSDEMMDRVLAPLRAEWENAPLGDNAMLRAAGDAFCRVARRAAWTYADQMRQSGFRTGATEARFGPGEALPPIALRLSGEERCWVEGCIDRIDFFSEGGERWLRVVDYKSGKASLDPSRVYGGLQLQLLLYLSAALAAYPDSQPAGAFYARFDDPLVATESRDAEEVEKQISRELRLNGLVVRDARVIRAMGGMERYLKKDGGLSGQAGAATREEMAGLMRHARRLSERMARRIAQGDIGIRPAQLKRWRACQWCAYQAVCGFDASRPECRPRLLEPLSKEELLERARQTQKE